MTPRQRNRRADEPIKGSIPIRAAEHLSEQSGCPIVVIFALQPGLEKFTVVSYGATKKLCRVAASWGDSIAEEIFSGQIRVADPGPGT